jgi:hypothetical protein
VMLLTNSPLGIESLASVSESRRERPGADTRGLRLFGAEAAGIHHRLTRAGLKLEPTLAKCGAAERSACASAI